MIAQIQVRRGTTAEWAAASPVVLAAGEPGYDTTLKMLKFGDGATEWASLESETLKKYPVGAIYQSTVSTSPATLFGGTWSAIAAGKMLVGFDAADADFDTVEETGGAKTHAHDLSSAGYAQIAVVEHVGPIARIHFNTVAVSNVTDRYTDIDGKAVPTGGGDTRMGVPLDGATDSGSSLPPYLVVYMWKRTA